MTYIFIHTMSILNIFVYLAVQSCSTNF